MVSFHRGTGYDLYNVPQLCIDVCCELYVWVDVLLMSMELIDMGISNAIMTIKN